MAWRLAKGETCPEVIYVELPLTVLSFFKWITGRADYEAAERWRRIRRHRAFCLRLSEAVTVVTPLTLLPLTGFRMANRLEAWLRSNIVFMRLRRVMKKQCRGHILWVSHPLVPPRLVRRLEPSLLWYDDTEDFALQSHIPEAVKEEIRKNIAWYVSEASVMSAVNRERAAVLAASRKGVHFIPNGADVASFGKQSMPVPDDLGRVPQPRLAFVGMLNDRLDWNLLTDVARVESQWSFVLIGPVKVDGEVRRKIQDLGNVHLLGAKEYQRLPSYLHHCRLGFSFYKDDHGNRSRNPQKAFLYLAAGIPAISTLPVDGVPPAAAEYVVVAAGADEFRSQAARLLSSGVSVPPQVIEPLDWGRRVAAVVSVINACPGTPR